MDEKELDRLLAAARPEVGVTAVRASVALAAEVRAHDTRTRRTTARRRLLWIVPGAALALSGSGTLAAYQLHVPPFQTLEPGVQRVQPGIRVEYAEPDGRKASCLAFIEARRLDDSHYAALKALSADPATGTAVSRAAQAASDSAAPDGEDRERRVGRAVGAALLTLATGRLPDLKEGPAGEPAAPTFNGYSMTCAPGAAR